MYPIYTVRKPSVEDFKICSPVTPLPITEQTDWQAKHFSQIVASRKIWNVEELETSHAVTKPRTSHRRSLGALDASLKGPERAAAIRSRLELFQRQHWKYYSESQNLYYYYLEDTLAVKRAWAPPWTKLNWTELALNWTEQNWTGTEQNWTELNWH